MDVDRDSKEQVIEQVRETLDGQGDATGGLEAFHVTATHPEGVEYMVSTADRPEREPEPLLECLAADVTAVARLLDEEPVDVAESVGRMAAEKNSVGERWDDPSD